MVRRDIARLIETHGPGATLSTVLSSLGFECPACAGQGYIFSFHDDPMPGSSGMLGSKSNCGLCGGTGSTSKEMVQKVVITEVKDGWVSK